MKGNSEPDINRLFWEQILKPLLVFAIIFIVCFFLVSLTGCSFFKQLDKKEDKKATDSVKVVKEISGGSSVDTSKIKKAETSIKETVYYPQPIYIEGKNGETKVVFVPQSVKESGTKTEETDNAKFENWMKNFQDSMRIVALQEKLDKQSDTKVKVLDFWQILSLGMIGLVVIYLIANKFIPIKKP